MKTLLDLWLVSFVYLGFHILLFFGIIRNLRTLNSEKGIFLYHLISFFIFCGLLLVCHLGFFTSINIHLLDIFGLASIHFIYSLSFLELWALSEGGFSLAILKSLKSGAAVYREREKEYFEHLAKNKLKNRLASLVVLKICHLDDGRLRLTLFGKTINLVCIALIWLGNIRERG